MCDMDATLTQNGMDNITRKILEKQGVKTQGEL